MKRRSVLPELIILIFLTLTAAAVVYLNMSVHREPAVVITEVSEPPVLPEVTPSPLPAAETTSEPVPEPTVRPAPPVMQRDLHYDKTSYDAITDILTEFRYNGTAARGKIDTLLETLKSRDTEQGTMWENIINYWIYANTDMVLNRDCLPDGLADDSSLCIVILGYKLENDGSMSDELVKRCEVGLTCAKQYPNAYIAVTGGGTALNSDNTEAGVMADWLAERGVDRSRIIIENNSQTTGQNAQFTLAILRDSYPEIRSVAIVSSGYHIPEGSLVFYEEAQLNAYKYCIEPLNIVSNAYVDMGFSYFGNINSQASYIWELADVSY